MLFLSREDCIQSFPVRNEQLNRMLFHLFYQWVRTRIGELFHLVLAGFLATSSCILHAENFTTSQRIEAFDPNNPTQIIGYFDPNITIDIQEYVAASKMYRVRFVPPNGKEVFTLCKPEALGKVAQDLKDASIRYSSNVPVFGSLLNFEPSVWQQDSSKFALHQSRFNFIWVSYTDQNTSRCGRKLSLMDFPVYETIARFESNKLHQLTVLL